ncbi:hypothetical protein M011DRAFT_472761 [Sporormia fimetaria CBS 119925]|uniref:Uncharacterized protein n=1 Tax=Sporormia fimetaria CBS 119925 TaxID=1340428 RepID=A0A6A6UVF1_9PLEO|nr:hypothetical protein M011DRAFT_472761 [Sporormia fimetaria CBS 119925]
MFSNPPTTLIRALAATALLPLAIAKPYPVHIDELRDLHNQLQNDKRQELCAGNYCGDASGLCCTGGQTCGTDPSNGWAMCVGGTAQQPGQWQGEGQPQAQITSGWQYWTSTWVETDFVTRTSVYSSWVGGAAAPTAADTCSAGQQECGGTCCYGGYYCYSPEKQECRQLGGASSGGVVPIPTATPTPTGVPTATLPFTPPIATGVDGVPAAGQEEGDGLSGGAIAGIVIGVIAGVLLLLFICLYCCAKSALGGLLAMFGIGKKKKRHVHEETYIEEHHHHSSAAGGGGRRWYGQAGSSRPARPAPAPKKKGGFGNALGIGAALGGLALALGMKRKHDRKYDDKSTVISGSSEYYSDYTSSSSASSSDRHTRPTRHSSRR